MQCFTPTQRFKWYGLIGVSMGHQPHPTVSMSDNADDQTLDGTEVYDVVVTRRTPNGVRTRRLGPYVHQRDARIAADGRKNARVERRILRA